MAEGLRFSSLLYLLLIWIRATKFVFGNPDQIAKMMQGCTHPCFQNFFKKQSTDSYIEGLCKSLKSLNIGGPSKQATSKRKLLELLDKSDSSSEEGHGAGLSKKKEHLYSDNNELEEVSAVLRSSSISDEVFEPLQAEETSSKVTKKKKKK